jgi:hypothetical protein
MYNHFAKGQTPCFVPAQDSVVCLSKQGMTDILFDQISSYGPRGFTDLINVIALVALVLYFVTSSDSGSLVVDIISANGHPEPPVWQRILWACTEGATACALLAAGRNLPSSDGSLKALQSASLFTGLPYTFILFWAAQSLYLCCREEAGDLDKDRCAFKLFILDIPDTQYLKRLATSLIAPGFVMGRVIKKVGGWPFSDKPDVAFVVWAVFYQGIYLMAVIFVLCTPALYQWCIIGLVTYLGFATFLAFLRTHVRVTYKIEHGDMLTDLICAVFLPMFTVAQMDIHVEEEEIPAEIEDAKRV